VEKNKKIFTSEFVACKINDELNPKDKTHSETKKLL
tara:strand:+ start:335 stop:442 length:108 start_codon:yes stop_codon:yes gene_type:complete